MPRETNFDKKFNPLDGGQANQAGKPGVFFGARATVAFTIEVTTLTLLPLLVLYWRYETIDNESFYENSLTTFKCLVAMVLVCKLNELNSKYNEEYIQAAINQHIQRTQPQIEQAEVPKAEAPKAKAPKAEAPKAKTTDTQKHQPVVIPKIFERKPQENKATSKSPSHIHVISQALAKRRYGIEINKKEVIIETSDIHLDKDKTKQTLNAVARYQNAYRVMGVVVDVTEPDSQPFRDAQNEVNSADANLLKIRESTGYVVRAEGYVPSRFYIR